MARTRSIEIYLKPGIEEDDQVYSVWMALREGGRPQDVFRRMLRLGLKAMVEAGELPRVALTQVDTDVLAPVVPLPPAATRTAGKGKGAPTPQAETKHIALPSAVPFPLPEERPSAPVDSKDPNAATKEFPRAETRFPSGENAGYLLKETSVERSAEQGSEIPVPSASGEGEAVPPTRPKLRRLM